MSGIREVINDVIKKEKAKSTLKKMDKKFRAKKERGELSPKETYKAYRTKASIEAGGDLYRKGGPESDFVKEVLKENTKATPKNIADKWIEREHKKGRKLKEYLD